LKEKTFILVRENVKQVEIIDYSPEFEDFKRLNYEWIEKYFKLSQLTISR